MITTQTQTQIKPLPTRISLRQERMDADAAIRRSVRDLQGAYKGLNGIEELQPLPEDLQELTTEWIKAKTAKPYELIEADLSLTAEERKTRLRAWSSLRARATRYINTIMGVLTQWPDATWLYDEAINNYYCANISEVAEAQATHDTPEEAQEHWRMIWECIEAVRRLRAWEDAHDVASRPLATLQTIGMEQFAELWCNGNMKFDRRFAHLGINPQNFHDPHDPNRVII